MPAESAVFERQRPLRARYRDHPADARATKWACTAPETTGTRDPFHGEVAIGAGFGTKMRFGLDDHVGGLHDLPNPGDLLCAALSACTDGSIRMMANLLGITLEELSVEVSGQVDVRGALMIDPSAPVGFESLACKIRLLPSAESDPALVSRLLEMAERSCVNLDTLRHGLDVAITIVPLSAPAFRTDLAAGRPASLNDGPLTT